MLGRSCPSFGFEIGYFEAGVRAFSGRGNRSCDLLVVLGGPIGVYEVEAYPLLVQETAAIGDRLRAKRPTLGICLGAQLMAAALGARVGPGPAKEIGYAPLNLTPPGLNSLLAPLNDQPVLHWHGDNFDLPPGRFVWPSPPPVPIRLSPSAPTPWPAIPCRGSAGSHRKLADRPCSRIVGGENPAGQPAQAGGAIRRGDGRARRRSRDVLA